MGQQRAPGRQNILDHRFGNLVPSQFRCGLDHRKREALGPIAIKFEIAPFTGIERVAGDVGVGKGLEHRHQRLFGRVEMPHIVPEGVVGIQADELDCHVLILALSSGTGCYNRHRASIVANSERRTPGSLITGHPTVPDGRRWHRAAGRSR